MLDPSGHQLKQLTINAVKCYYCDSALYTGFLDKVTVAPDYTVYYAGAWDLNRSSQPPPWDWRQSKSLRTPLTSDMYGFRGEVISCPHSHCDSRVCISISQVIDAVKLAKLVGMERGFEYNMAGCCTRGVLFIGDQVTVQRGQW